MSERSAIDTGRDGPESAALAGGWLVNIDGDEIVEMTRVQVVASFGSGRIQEHTLVWHEGMDDWLPLVQVPAFRLLSLRESSIPESGARVKTRSKPPPKPLRRTVTEVGLAPPAPAVGAGSRPYGDAEGTTDSVTLSREALELLGRDVLEIAEREALEVQQTSDSVTVARALLEPNLEAPSEPRSPDDTSVLAVYDRPVAIIEFPKGGDESTPGAKLDDDPTQMRAPIAPPPAPVRKVTPVAFPPPTPQNAPEAKSRTALPAPITSATPRSTMPALRQPEPAARIPATIRPAAGTPAVTSSALPPAPERRPPMRNPPPAPLDARGSVAPAAPVAAQSRSSVAPSATVPANTRGSVVPSATVPATPRGSAAPSATVPAAPPVAGPTPVAFAAQAPPVVAAVVPPVVAAPAAPAVVAPAPLVSIPAGGPRVPIPTALAPAATAALSAPSSPAFRAASLPSLTELDASALRGGRRVPLLWAVGGCLASAVIASIVTALVTAKPEAPAVAAAPAATMEPPKVTPPPPAPVMPPVATEAPAPPASADLPAAAAAQVAAEKPKKAPVAWKPRPKPKAAVSDSPYETPASEKAAAPAPTWQGDPSGLEKPASAETSPSTADPGPASTFNPGF